MDKPKDIKNILVTRTDKLGDVILTLPLIPEIKRNFPESKLTFLVSKYVKDLIENYEGIDELMYIEDNPAFTAKLWFFRNQKFDVVINVFPRFQLALLFFLSGVKIRIGSGYRWYSFLYNRKVYEHRKYAEKHEADYNLNLLRQLIPEINYNKKFHFKYSNQDFENLKDKLKKYNFNILKKFIILHPSSKGSAIDLPLEKFKILCSDLLKYFKDFSIVVTGTKTDIGTTEFILSAVKNEKGKSVYNFSGILNLKELMILIDKSDLFISNSTGPIHIAGALNKNIIGFYPKEIPMNPERWKPLSENAIIICPASNGDMNTISTERILEAVGNLLNKSKIETK